GPGMKIKRTGNVSEVLVSACIDITHNGRSTPGFVSRIAGSLCIIDAGTVGPGMRGTELVTQFVRQYPYVAFEVVGQVTRKGFTFVEFANGPHAGGHPCGTPSAIGSEEMAQIIITPSDGGDQLFVE